MAKTKILVISSDPVLLEFLQGNLDENGYHVVSTSRVSEDLKTELDKQLPDLVMLDIMMPNLDGIEVCLRIRQWSSVPIMMLSAWGTGVGKVRGLNLGTDSYLTEPFGIDELVVRIKETMQRNLLALSLLPNIYPGVSTEVN